MHLDGARGLNAAVYLGITPAEMAKDFTTVSVCLSKGLGCPAGSLVLGPKKWIEHALITRKLLGGSMRQAGIYARAGLENLKNWEKMLKIDHENTQWIAEQLEGISCIDIDRSIIETNIFRYSFKPDYKKFKHNEFAWHMRDNYGMLMNFSHKNTALRVVCHRNLSRK